MVEGTQFLKNAWYVAAWEREVVPDQILARTFLEEPVVLFRGKDGQVAAIKDRCPHRFAPLRLGEVVEGEIVCKYHGLHFGVDGRCTLNPHGDGTIAAGNAVRAYPVVQRYSAIWIWMGDPALADPELIHDYSMVFRDDVAIISDYLRPQSSYELMVDNLLDLGHTAYLHADSLGSDAIADSKRSCKREGDDVVYELWAPDGDAPPLFQELLPDCRGLPMDHWMVSRWQAPCNVQQHVGLAPAGNDRANAEILDGVHWLTPETKHSTHYFHALARRFRTSDPDLDKFLLDAITFAFEEQDFPMIEQIQREIGDADFWSLRPVILSVDSGGVMARRVLKSLINNEQSETAVLDVANATV